MRVEILHNLMLTSYGSASVDGNFLAGEIYSADLAGSGDSVWPSLVTLHKNGKTFALYLGISCRELTPLEQLAECAD